MSGKHRIVEEKNHGKTDEESVMNTDRGTANTDQAAVNPSEDITGTSAAGEENSIEVLTQEVEQQKRDAAENLEKALRAQAELENMRKRTARDIENAHKYALEKFVAELLPGMDSMELGISAVTNAEDINSVKEGMDLTLKMFAAALEKFGVKVIDPQGEKFNPDLHQAVSMQELKGTASGTVISVMQKGYELNGRLIRPAMVIVAK